MKDDHVREGGLKRLSVPIPSYMGRNEDSFSPLSIKCSLAKKLAEKIKNRFCHADDFSGRYYFDLYQLCALLIITHRMKLDNKRTS